MNNNANLLTGRWSVENIQRLAIRAVAGKNAYRYFRWTAFYIPRDALVEPTFWFMMDALADGAVSQWARNAEAELVHAARLRFADWALAIHRRRQGGKVTGKRADWLPQSGEDRYGRPRPPEQLDSRDIRRLVESLTVEHMLLTCKREDFDVVDSYFNNGDGYGQRVAAKELSRRLGRHVSVGEFNAVLTETRLNLAEWILGYRVSADALGPWPDGRVWAGDGRRSWTGDGAAVGRMLDGIREQRRVA